MEKEGLVKRLHKIDTQISVLNAERTELRQQLSAMESPFKVGDLIEWEAGTAIKRGRVERFGPYTFLPEWLVIPVLKNGAHGCPIWVREYSKPRLVVEKQGE